MSHSHSFQSWPFGIPVETGVFTTRQVLEGLEPVREVYHDPDGDWQFLCGTTMDSADLKLVCFGCMFDRDPSIGGLAELPHRWCATRQAPDFAWVHEEYEPRQDEA